jgi:hypothetical protein
VFVRFNTSRGKPKPITIKVLLDSGASGSLICTKFAKKLKLKKRARQDPMGHSSWYHEDICLMQVSVLSSKLEDKMLLKYELHVSPDLARYMT